jgi:WS/DGAT/MGAT family acyltransferase
MADAASKPAKYVQLQLRGLQAMGEFTRNRGVSGVAEIARNPQSAWRRREPSSNADAPAALPSAAAPPTPFNGSISAHRRVAFRSVPLPDVKAIKAATETTVNDVVMAACAGALRNYLVEHHALPDAPLVAAVPVSIRTGAEEDPWTNRVSSMFPALPTNLDDPIARLQAVAQTMRDAKKQFALVPADVLVQYADFAPPAMAIRAAQMTTQLRVADQMNPPINVVISNVPGPRQTLWLDEAEMLHYYPVSTISETQGLNITVQSYRDTLDVGLVGVRHRVPDIDRLVDLIVDEFDVLASAAGLSPSPGP